MNVSPAAIAATGSFVAGGFTPATSPAYTFPVGRDAGQGAAYSVAHSFPVAVACRATALAFGLFAVLTQDATLTLVKNGVDQAISATVLAGNTAAVIGTGSIQFSAGDRLSVKFTTAGTMTVCNWSVVLL